MELFTAQPDLDTVYAPIGMGSGICGLITARDLLGLKTKIVGVVSTEADSYKQSFVAQQIIGTDTAHTFADGMACRLPMQDPLDIIVAGAERIVSVTDDEIAHAMRVYYSDSHSVAESAGAAPLAALLQEKDKMAGKKVSVILSGGNVDKEWFQLVLNGQTPTI